MNRKLTLALVLALSLLAVLGTTALAAGNPLSVFAVPSLPATLPATYCDLSTLPFPGTPPGVAVQTCLNTQANTTITFNADGTFTTGVGVPGTFAVNPTAGTLTLVDSTKTCVWTGVPTTRLGAPVLAGAVFCNEGGTNTLMGAAVIFVPAPPR